MSPSAYVVTLLMLKMGSADISFIKEKKLLRVPMMMDGKLIAYSVK